MVARLERELTDLKERESRLVHLYTLGEVREETLRSESAGQASAWCCRSGLGR